MKSIKTLLILALIGFILSSCEKGDSVVQSGGIGGGEAGQSGSMAKFSIYDNNLFLINEKSLLVYDITNKNQPVEINKIDVNFGIETVFTLKGRLFIGSIDGVYIYDVTDPRNILYLSHYQHITSCDPVVANDTLAFATLNSQSTCRWQNGANQLDVIDINNVVNPTLINSFFMNNPKGLAIDGNHVFVCNGESGVVIYDFSNPQYLVPVSGIAGIDSYDIILRDNIMYLIGKQGLFQYNYSDLDQIQLLSNIIF